jgi:hypothetical protein
MEKRGEKRGSFLWSPICIYSCVIYLLPTGLGSIGRCCLSRHCSQAQ